MNFQDKLVKLVKKSTGLNVVIEIPPNPELGDYAFPCFPFARQLKKSPAIIAQDLAKQIDYAPYIELIAHTGPYVNFFIKKEYLAKNILQGTESSVKPKKKSSNKIVIEYSQPNPLKAFHVGHIRGTSYGEALSRCLKQEGNKVVQVNYMGDTGSHVAKWLWCYKKYHDGEKPPKQDKEKWLAKIYVESYKKSQESKKAETEISNIYQALENKTDKSLLQLWKKAKQWSLDEFYTIYDDLQANFDKEYFESEMEKRGKAIAYELLDKKIAKKSDDAVIIDLEKYNLGVWVLLRKDGTTLYSSKDLALAEKKLHEYKYDISITATGAAQNLHFQQIQQTLKLMKFPKAKEYLHLGFAEIRLPGKKMSSRTGVNILYSELKREMTSAAYTQIDTRHPEWRESLKQSIALDIFVGAIKYVMLSQDLNKPITFNPKESINFEGDTGPYLQYTHARACSILKKQKITDKINYKLLNSKEEIQLIKKIGEFGHTIEKISENYKTNNLANYANDLCKLFNTFYHKHQVLQEDTEMQAARLYLVENFRKVISKSLELLAIPAPETI